MLLTILVAIGFGGCIASHQSVVADVNVEDWRGETTITMLNSDTTTLRDLDIFVRHTPSVSPQSFGVVIESIAPDSSSFTEEITIHLDTRNKGKISIRPYRTNGVWRQIGEYKMNITPTTKVSGVEAVGLNIKRTEE